MPIQQCYEKKDPTNLQLKVEIDIDAPIAIVFDVITDLELFQELEPIAQSVTITSDIKQGVGTKSHWVVVDPFTKEQVENDEEIIYYDPPYQYGFKVLSGNQMSKGAHTLLENNDGTTHLHLCETFYFTVDPQAYREVIEELVKNIKRVAEKRFKSN